MNAGTGVPMSTICDEFTGSGANGCGFWLETPPRHPMLAAVATVGFGRSHVAVARDDLRTGAIIAIVRDGADPELSNGRVTWGRDWKLETRCCRGGRPPGSAPPR